MLDLDVVAPAQADRIGNAVNIEQAQAAPQAAPQAQQPAAQQPQSFGQQPQQQQQQQSQRHPRCLTCEPPLAALLAADAGTADQRSARGALTRLWIGNGGSETELRDLHFISRRVDCPVRTLTLRPLALLAPLHRYDDPSRLQCR